MNEALYRAARKRGCTLRQAETLATYVESEKISIAAKSLGISTSTAQDHLSAVYARLDVSHAAAAVAVLLGEPPLSRTSSGDPRIPALR